MILILILIVTARGVCLAEHKMQPEASGLPCGLNDQIHRCKESLISEFGRALENDKICEQEEEIELTFIKLTGSIVIEINRNGKSNIGKILSTLTW